MTISTKAAFIKELKPSNRMGFICVAVVSSFTILALFLAKQENKVVWLVSQIILALAFLQWFILLHEAGHQTLFKSRILNNITGYVAGFFALLPYQSWYLIHARHHRWTGWQDKDATTASLVPRTLGKWEIFIIRMAWKYYLPLFSILYRINNFWLLVRVKLYTSTAAHKRITLNIVAQLVAYIILIITVGFLSLLTSCGLAFFLSLIMQDPILLSQHTHIPQNISGGKDVTPFPVESQAQFTRSLSFPKWFSTLILHFDAHELHHHYPYISGYYLHKLPAPINAPINWWVWLRAAKKLPAEVFMFQNRNQTGFNL